MRENTAWHKGTKLSKYDFSKVVGMGSKTLYTVFDGIKYRTFLGRVADKFANKLLRYWLKGTNLAANKRMWYASINNRLWIKFTSNSWDLFFFLIKERTEAIRKFRFSNVIAKKETLVVSKRFVSQPTQLFAWLHPNKQITYLLLVGFFRLPWMCARVS